MAETIQPVSIPEAPASAADEARRRIAAARRPPAAPAAQPAPTSSSSTSSTSSASSSASSSAPSQLDALDPSPSSSSTSSTSSASSAPSSSAAPQPGGKKKRSGWDRAKERREQGGTFRAADYNRTKAQLAEQLAGERAAREEAERKAAAAAAREEAARRLLEGEQGTQTAAGVGAVIGMAFSMAAARQGAHWQLTDAERAQLGQAGAVALAPYLGAVAAHLPAILFVSLLADAIQKRGAEDRRIAEERAKGWPVKDGPATAAAPADVAPSSSSTSSTSSASSSPSSSAPSSSAAPQPAGVLALRQTSDVPPSRIGL